MKTAIVTGASSGIGKEIALQLSKRGYYIVLVARREALLSALLPQLSNGGEIYVCDLSSAENCHALFSHYKNKKIDILVNNAGFGVFGAFHQTPLSRDIQMLQTNILAPHILTKLFLQDMLFRNQGYILNVASLAGFMSGPLMGAYYASKAYVIRLSRAILKEIKGSRVRISVLCPGPVDTEFNDVAGVRFSIPPQKAERVAEVAVKRMLKGKFLTLPGWTTKLSAFFSKCLPDTLLSEISLLIQKGKRKR